MLVLIKISNVVLCHTSEKHEFHFNLENVGENSLTWFNVPATGTHVNEYSNGTRKVQIWEIWMVGGLSSCGNNESLNDPDTEIASVGAKNVDEIGQGLII